MTATMFTKEYGHKSPWVGVGAYSVATATGLMRMANNKHWLSDVLTGAGIGILSTEVGYYFADLIFREKGINRFANENMFDRMDKPSFVSLYLGLNIPLSGYDIDEEMEFRTSSGSSAGVEGAYFFNPYVGVGGRFTVSNTLIIVNEERAENNTFDAISLCGGSYFSYPLSSRWLIGSKLLGGYVHYPHQLTGLYTVDAEAGYNSLIPTLSMTDFSALGDTFGQCFHADFDGISIVNFIVVIFSFLFVDIFDTLGTLIGVCNKANMLDKDGKLPKIKPALLADSIATTAGAVLGTSTTTTFVESSAGVAAGGRTGFSAVITAILFLISMFFAPIFIAIPSFATAPALVIVGFLMFSSITEISFKQNNYLHAIPAYLCVLAMPLFYSISEGISIGIISFVLLHLVCGKGKEVKPLLYVLAMLFLLKYIFL